MMDSETLTEIKKWAEKCGIKVSFPASTIQKNGISKIEYVIFIDETSQTYQNIIRQIRQIIIQNDIDDDNTTSNALDYISASIEMSPVKVYMYCDDDSPYLIDGKLRYMNKDYIHVIKARGARSNPKNRVEINMMMHTGICKWVKDRRSQIYRNVSIVADHSSVCQSVKKLLEMGWCVNLWSDVLGDDSKIRELETLYESYFFNINSTYYPLNKWAVDYEKQGNWIRKHTSSHSEP
jgi:hypothetical protein